IGVLEDWLINGNSGQMQTAAALLQAAPNHFVFDKLDLVTRALNRAEAFGNDCVAAVASAFFRIARSQLFPEDIKLRERCEEVLSKAPEGEATFRLFLDVLRSTERGSTAPVQEQEDEE